MQFTLTINLDNYYDRNPDGLASLLQDVAHQVQAGHGNGKVRGWNGDYIGEFDITGDVVDE